MTIRRKEKISSILLKLGAEFVERESSGKSIITITNIDVSPDLSEATLFFTTFPDAQEKDALSFLKRQRTNFREYVKKYWRMNPLPSFDFEIDKGEKNRQNIDKLLGH